jgi:CubicO group peptidase (beta-lactamase class C family)
MIRDSITLFYGVEIRGDSLHTVHNDDQVFEIGSLTKLFTAYLLAEAVVASDLDINTTVQSLLPQLDIPQPDITLLQLANHTSGLPRMPSNWSIWEADLKNPYAHFDKSYFKEYLEQEMTLNAIPGETFAYSNLGMAILGMALEAWSGQNYATLIDDWICQPLKLNRTGLDRTPVEAYLVPGLNRRGAEIPYWDLNAMAPAGGLLSTSRDLERFLRSLMIKRGEDRHLMLKPTHKSYQGGQRLSVGLGWMIKSMGDEMIYWHNGGTSGFTSTVHLNLPAQTGIIILSNVSAIYGNKRVNIEQLADRLLSTLGLD